jgi:hypothetical protein
MAAPPGRRDSTDMIGMEDKRRDEVGMPMSSGLTPLVAFNADHEHLRVERPVESRSGRRWRGQAADRRLPRPA